MFWVVLDLHNISDDQANKHYWIQEIDKIQEPSVQQILVQEI